MGRRRLVFASLLALVPALLIACGGGSNDDASDGGSLSEIGDVPTATLPAETPEAVIVGGVTPGPGNGGQSGEQSYVVQEGDSPASIAAQFGISVEDLIAANGIVDPTGLIIGQELIIPSAAPETDVLGSTEEPESTPEEPDDDSPGGVTYVVQEGDVADQIASDFGVTVEELAAANGTTVADLRSLSIGDELIIPPPSE